jgi:hypothetical protein
MVELFPCSVGWACPALVYPRKFFSALIRAFSTVKSMSFVCAAESVAWGDARARLIVFCLAPPVGLSWH